MGGIYFEKEKELANLLFRDLPDCIKKEYVSKQIHKIVKPSQTSMTIHTKSREKHNWRKSGNEWFRAVKEEASQDVCDTQ